MVCIQWVFKHSKVDGSVRRMSNGKEGSEFIQERGGDVRSDLFLPSSLPVIGFLNLSEICQIMAAQRRSVRHVSLSSLCAGMDEGRFVNCAEHDTWLAKYGLLLSCGAPKQSN